MTFSEAGRKGGTALFNKVGTAGMSAKGKLGGRPRNLSYAELKEKNLLRNIEINKEVVTTRRESDFEKNLKLVAKLINSEFE